MFDLTMHSAHFIYGYMASDEKKSNEYLITFKHIKYLLAIGASIEDCILKMDIVGGLFVVLLFLFIYFTTHYFCLNSFMVLEYGIGLHK